MWIIITGSIVAGFEFIGPFESYGAACAHGNTDGNIDGNWDVAKVDAPDAA